MKSRPFRSALTVLPVLGLSIATGIATTATASAAPATRVATPSPSTTPSASTAPPPNLAPAPAAAPAWLNSISCTSATFCMAVGGDPELVATQVAAEWWDGDDWHRLSIPTPGHLAGVDLDAVSCPSATECVAVGSGMDQNGNWLPIAETWTHSGGWKTGTPMVPTGTYSALEGISCPSTSLCYASGTANLNAPLDAGQLPLVERWTPGGGWVRVTLPRLPDSAYNDLPAISCASATQCAAVGSYFTSPADDVESGLIEQLNGSAWSVATAPESTHGQLKAVSCPSPRLCVAVGAQESSSLAERWSGGTWTAATPPSAGKPSEGPALNGVSCASTTHCVAVGGAASAFVDTLNATTWMITAQYGPGFEIGSLVAVSCLSASAKAVNCATIDGWTPFGDSFVPLSAFLTGSTWSIVPTV